MNDYNTAEQRRKKKEQHEKLTEECIAQLKNN